jgi:endonuclease/exonuclease/phosphatase family metal-dependent hydrolase
VLLPRDTGVSVLPSGLLVAVLDREYKVRSDCFCSYLDYHNVECLSNKGFYVVRLYHKASKRALTIVNTHTQSDTEVSWWFGKKRIQDIRRKQIQQLLDFITDPVPALVIGDLNCEHSPHPHLRFLSLHSSAPLRKRTFYSTGEDLDHIGWLPLQWTNPNCAFCDIERNGPRMESCQVLQKPWSDHAPVLATIYVPEKPKPK